MECRLSNTRKEDNGAINIESQEVPEKAVRNKIAAGWLKWRSASGVLFYRQIPIRLMGRF